MKKIKNFVLALSAVFFAICVISVASSEETAQTSAPNASSCTLYNYQKTYSSTSNPDPQVPTLYMWNVGDGVTVRVYSTATDGVLIGEARQGAIPSCCVVPLNPDYIKTTTSSARVYVTQQAEGELESERTAVTYGRAGSPSIDFVVYKMRDSVMDGSALLTQSSRSVQVKPNELTEGYYYVVDVTLKNFGPIVSINLPIKYDPEVWQLAALTAKTVDGDLGYAFSGSCVSTTASGTYLTTFLNTLTIGSAASTYAIGGYPPYGIGIYDDFVTWSGIQDVSSISSQRETPYVNTETGLIKLDIYTNNSSNLPTAPASTSSKFIRLYFKCLSVPDQDYAGTAWSDTPILGFATTDDIPDGITNLSEQRMHCSLTSPHGATAAIYGINVLAPPLSVKTTSPCSDENALVLSADEVLSAPGSIASSSARKALDENQIRIYNYTNYAQSSTLDYTDYRIQDALTITPGDVSTAPGAARVGYAITVYNTDGTVIAGPTKILDSGGITMLLGTTNLNPDGGSVYVTVTRGMVESAKVEVFYDAEMERNVNLRLYTTSDDSYSGEQLHSISVSRGDQLKLELRFDDIADLLSYTLALHFNSDIIKVSDSNFDIAASGAVTAEALKAGESGIAFGADAANITFADAAVLSLYERRQNGDATDTEISELAEALGISNDEFNSIAALTAELMENALWQGGVICDGTSYPYIDNENGLIKFSAASLTVPNAPLVSDNGDGFHFLTIYFVAAADGDPGIRLASRSDASYDANIIGDGEIVLAGPGKSATAITESSLSLETDMEVNYFWTVHSMTAIEKKGRMHLKSDSSAPNNDNGTIVIINGSSYTDPGILLRDIIGAEITDISTVKRYIIYDDIKEELAPISETEMLDNFTVRTDESGALKYSDTYTILYEYTDENSNLITAQRTINVVFDVGDTSRNGAIDLFDEQVLANMLNAAITVADPLYLGHTADINGDGAVNAADYTLLHEYSLGFSDTLAP